MRATNTERITRGEHGGLHVSTDLVVADAPRQKIEDLFSGIKEGFKEDDNTGVVL